MKLNPEFERNLWLDFSLQRLLVFPLILGLMPFIMLVGSDFELERSMAHFNLFVFVLVAGFWGTKQASAAIFEEVVGRTWDWQRMSGLSPWSMTWGKLFGATLFVWYGGLLCLLMAAWVLWQVGTPNDWQWFFVALLGALLSQALGFLLSLLYVRSRTLDNARVRGSLYLLVLLLVVVLAGKLAEVENQAIRWFGWQMDLLEFSLLSLLSFWLWTVIGAYRVMRRELSYSARPWVWLAFLAFCILYLGGTLRADLTQWLAVAYLVGHLFSLLAIFVEPKDPVQWRGLLARLRAGELGPALLLVPSWLVSLLLAIGAMLGLQLVTGHGLVFIGLLGYPAALLSALLLLFLLRDLALFLLLSLTGESRRAEGTALVYLLVLYGLIPALLLAFELESWLVLFQPRLDQPAGLALGGALAGTLLMLGLLVRQWRRQSRRKAQGLA